MAYYRFYLLDFAGHIGAGVGFYCADDGAAISHAQTDAAKCMCRAEVWQGVRLVAEIAAG